MKNIFTTDSLESFQNQLKNHPHAYLLLYKKGTEQSDCAYENIKQIADQTEDVAIITANVNEVRDIHVAYGITTAPALLAFENGKYVHTVKGCHQPDFFKTVFEKNAFQATTSGAEKSAKRVTVYSTPTCSHCVTLKDYLRKHNIRFTDIDLSKNQDKAQELVKRTGQQGVPQTDINGKFVVGFDKNKIDNLLNIKG